MTFPRPLKPTLAILAAMQMLSPVHAASWDEVIPEVKARSEFLLEEASRLSARDLGANGFAVIDAEIRHMDDMRALHFCAIAGRMIGREEDFRLFETIDYITSTDDASQAQIDQMILDALSRSS